LSGSPVIEIVGGAATIRVPRGSEVATLQAVLSAARFRELSMGAA
jgi:hypothetical protein